MILSIFMLLLILAWLFSLLTTTKPKSTSVAASNLSATFQSALDAFQKQYNFPGATAAFVLQDGTVGVAATGVADIEAGTLMDVQSRMLSASIGKTFVGATTLALAHEGLLDLDIPVSRWLGDRQWFTRLPNYDAITLRHLLNHTSGLPDHVHLQSFATAVSHKWREKDNPFPPETLIQFFLDLPPLFKAGKGWAYTDTGYILIGLVIENATARSYYDEIKQRFLTPLGLKLTAPAERRDLPGLAAGYMAADNAFGLPRKTITADGVMVWHPGFEWTGGGLVSNSRELALWGAALFRGNAMPHPYLDELLNSVPISPDTAEIQYGAGIGIYRTGPFGPVYGHGGWVPGYSSSLRYYPDHGVAIAFQINTDIDIVDDTTNLVSEMEARLAEIIISATSSFSNGH
ncbi:MAG: beta-lactamase family protein [Gammaproteobacteria bacterium]|nr:beta-lactamase family protein [Gammaproteobacteria bacterium]